jgi:prepilin-type N-terminal cleavage/methylation domain-containing protein
MRRTGGFTLIELMIVIAIIAIIAAIAIPNLIQARKAGNETAAIGALRSMNTAQALFREEDKDNNGTLDYASCLLALQTNGNLVDSILGTGTKQGYSFTILSSTQFSYTAQASPLNPGRSGDRYFFIDESGVIRFNDAQPATSLDIPIGG